MTMKTFFILLMPYLVLANHNTSKVANNSCKPSTNTSKTLSTEKNFSLEKYVGVWYSLLHTCKNYDGNQRCWIDEIHEAPDGSGFEGTSSVFRVSENKRDFTTSVMEPTITGFRVDYPGFGYYNDDVCVYATDYTCFVVEGICPDSRNPDNANAWIKFRKANVDDATVNKAKKAAAKAGLDPSAFVDSC